MRYVPIGTGGGSIPRIVSCIYPSFLHPSRKAPGEGVKVDKQKTVGGFIICTAISTILNFERESIAHAPLTQQGPQV